MQRHQPTNDGVIIITCTSLYRTNKLACSSVTGLEVFERMFASDKYDHHGVAGRAAHLSSARDDEGRN